jgi:DNA-binding transcriptional LysR family regulator
MTLLVRFLYLQGIGCYVEVRQLKYFVAVAEELSFSRAAKRLFIAQPPLSRQISHLEQEIGVSLFERSTRHVYLTPAGKKFLAKARQILKQFESAAEEAKRFSGKEPPRIRIGHLPALTHDFLAGMLTELRRRESGIEIILLDMRPEAQMQALAEDEIDIGFTYSLGENGSYARQEVLTCRLNVLLPEDWPAASEPEIDLRSLSRRGFLHIGPGGAHAHRDATMRLCKESGRFTPRFVRSVDSLDNLINLVAAGVGIAIVPSIVRSRIVPGVTLRPLREPMEWFHLYAVWSPRRVGPGLKIFLKLISEHGSINPEELPAAPAAA